MTEHAESSTAAVLSRYDDPISIALRSEGALELEDLVDLRRNASPVDEVLSTVDSIPMAVFSSHKPSSGTKPTSNGSSHAQYHYHGKGKGKAAVMYASSLSATQGSASDADVEQEQALIGVGDWAGDGAAGNRTLKGLARARKRQRACRRLKHKKPVVIVQQRVPDHVSAGAVGSSLASQVAFDGTEPNLVRRRSVRTEQNQESLAEEGRGSQLTEGDEAACMPLSPMRVRILTALIVLIGLTLGLATFAACYAAAHYSGKGRVASIKGVVFTATVLISGLSVLAMVVARRALHEALLAGLLQCAVGFVLVVEMHEFIM